MLRLSLLGTLALTCACRHPPASPGGAAVPADPRERHLANLRQLTFGGENAEAYFSGDGKELVFQSTRDGSGCDQIFAMSVDGSNLRRLSTGTGRTTCAYFFPDGKRILYASTHLASPDCPPKPSYQRGYVWPLYEYDLFVARPDGSDLRRLTETAGYDAEATIAPDGKWIVFTSVRDGDLELYKMRPDGSDLTRLTRSPGYDGGAFFSPDGTRLVYRAARPKDPAEAAEMKALLAEALVRPTRLEIFVIAADGTQVRQVTSNGKANFAPFFFPDGKRILFASNLNDPQGRNFDLYAVNDDGSGLEQITFNETFDGFPMFSPDGKKLAFGSNRFGKAPGETNVFIADWID